MTSNCNKVCKAELVDLIAEKSNLTKTDSEKALNAFVESIKESLHKHKEVSLVGFGSFYVVDREATIARNPRTRQTVHVPATSLPKFKAGRQLKEATAKSL